MSKITKQQLGAKIWEAAKTLRKNLEAYEYKDYILGLLLYKFLCQKQIEYLIEDGVSKDDLYLFDNKLDFTNFDFEKTKIEDKDEIDKIRDITKDSIGYFIEYHNLFNYWVENKNDFNIDVFQRAFNDFNDAVNKTEKNKFGPLFKDLFSKFENELDKLGNNTGERTDNILGLIDIIKDIPTTRQEYDVLGFIYEYLIAQFASTAGKKSGEFYTPHEVSDLMSRIVAYHLRERDKITVYDPTSGSGGLLLNIGKEFKKYNSSKSPVTYYAQEVKSETFNLTRMNLIMSNINPTEIKVRNADTLEDDWPDFDNGDPSTYTLLRVDAVVSNPPYSQKWDPEKASHKTRFDEYGIPPKNKAD